MNIGDESGALWALVSGTETPVEAEPGNLLQYGLSGSVWTMQTSGSPQAFRRLNIDPYQTTANNAYMAATVVELTGVTGLTLAKPAVVSTAGHSTAFGAFTSTITTGTLSSAATSGHLVMLFVSYQHDEFGTIGVPSGWNVLGNRRDPKTSTAVLWRTNFTGTSVTLSDLGPTKNIVTILCEFA